MVLVRKKRGFTSGAPAPADNALVIRSPSVAAAYHEYGAAVVGACRCDARRNGYG